MIEILLVASIIVVIGFKITSKDRFRGIGVTEGICKEVKVELCHEDSLHNEQMRGTDSRMYRPYIEYTWQGKQYIAKSYRAYSVAKFFPGDKVLIQVSENDKNIVKIVRMS